MSLRLILNQVPNLLSGFRLVAAPILVSLALTGSHKSFLILLVVTLSTDLFDGWIARKLGVASEFGAKLDSWGDLLLFFVVPFCTLYLWPEIVEEEALWLLLVLGGNAAAAFYAMFKFRALPSYHSWLAKGSAIFMSVAVLLLFMAEMRMPARVAAVVEFIVCLESLAITWMLQRPESNVGSAWHVWRKVGLK